MRLFLRVAFLATVNSTPALDDEVVDAWPPDFNDDQTVNIFDVMRMAPPIFFSSCVP